MSVEPGVGIPSSISVMILRVTLSESFWSCWRAAALGKLNQFQQRPKQQSRVCQGQQGCRELSKVLWQRPSFNIGGECVSRDRGAPEGAGGEPFCRHLEADAITPVSLHFLKPSGSSQSPGFLSVQRQERGLFGLVFRIFRTQALLRSPCPGLWDRILRTCAHWSGHSDSRSGAMMCT